MAQLKTEHAFDLVTCTRFLSIIDENSKKAKLHLPADIHNHEFWAAFRNSKNSS